MATDFVKLYRTFFLGSMRDSPPWTRLVFLACLSLADDTGVFVARPDAIAGFAAIPLADVELALKQLTEPDPNDTSGEEEGRRLASEGPNKWRVVNYRRYYDMNRAMERKAYLRDAQRRHRASKRAECQQVSTNVNVSTLKEKKGKERKRKERGLVLSDSDVLVKTVLDRLTDASGKRFKHDGAQAGHVRARLKDGATADELGLVADHRSNLWGSDPKMREYLRPETIFCNKHWEAYLQAAEEWDAVGRPPPAPSGKPVKETLAQANRRLEIAGH